jgi:K+-sensing histidine kinase KdpD
MPRKNGIEEIIMTFIAIIVLISVFSTLLADLNFSSIINQSLFNLLFVAIIFALIIKIMEELRKLF